MPKKTEFHTQITNHPPSTDRRIIRPETSLYVNCPNNLMATSPSKFFSHKEQDDYQLGALTFHYEKITQPKGIISHSLTEIYESITLINKKPTF